MGGHPRAKVRRLRQRRRFYYKTLEPFAFDTLGLVQRVGTRMIDLRGLLMKLAICFHYRTDHSSIDVLFSKQTLGR